MQVKKIITPKVTGYASAAGIGLTIVSGLSKNKSVRKAHKPLGWISAGLTLVHIGLIEYYHFKYSAHKSNN